MPKSTDVTDELIADTSGPGDHIERVRRAKPHTNLIRLIKGKHLRVCRIEAPPPKPSNAYSSTPYNDRYYIVRESCPSEVADGQLWGTKRRTK